MMKDEGPAPTRPSSFVIRPRYWTGALDQRRAGPSRYVLSEPQSLALGIAGAGLAVVLHGLVDNSYFVLDLAYAIWALLLMLELASDPRREVASQVDGPNLH